MNTNELRNKRHDEQRIFFKVDVLAVRGDIIAKIGADGFGTLATIASFMDEDGVCYPTQETLAEMMGVTRFTVIKRIHTLLETKLDDGIPVLERAWRNRTGGGVGKQSVYKVNMACGVSMGRDSKDVKSIDVKESHVSEIHVEEKHALMLKNSTNNVNNFNVSDVVAASHKEEPVFKKNQEEEPIKEERKDKLSYLFLRKMPTTTIYTYPRSLRKTSSINPLIGVRNGKRISAMQTENVETQMNQVQFAKIVGISRALLAKIETNAKPISNSVERRIRTAFGLDDEKISQLLNNALYSVPGRN